MKQSEGFRQDQGAKKVRQFAIYKLAHVSQGQKQEIQSESIEYQAFSPWYDLLPYFPSSVSKLELADGRGGGCGAK